MVSEIIDGKEYRLVTLRGREKLIARDGSAINPHRRRQEATIHYNEDGYPCFGGGVPVHMYVAHGWVPGYFEGAEVNHIDFDRNNFSADNLEWTTHAENLKHSHDNNYEVWCKGKQGLNNGRATFTEEDVLRIRELYDSGMSIADILRIDHPELAHVEDYRSLHSTYLNICKRKTWKHLS